MEHGLYSLVGRGGRDSRRGSAPEAVSDPTILATQGGRVLLVLDAQKTRKGAGRRFMRSLEAVSANVPGNVMNNVKPDKKGYYGYGDVCIYGRC